MYRNENQVSADIKTVLASALSACGLSGWSVAQGFQREQYANMENLVRFFTVSVNRDGWQGRDYITESGELFRHERWREQRRVQIDCLLSRKVTDTVNTITAVDAARLLVAYFNGFGGTESLAEKDFGRLAIDSVRIPASLDNTERFRLNPGFDLILVYDQEMDVATAPVDKVSFETDGI